MSKEVDMELKKAFVELQEKQLDTSHKLRIADVQIDVLKRNKQHAMFTEREMSTLDGEVKTYESVGRMFVLTPLDKVKENLQKKQNVADSKIQALESKKTYLGTNLREAMDSLRELVNQKKTS